MAAAKQMVRATIESVWQETPTVKGLRLKLLGSLSFQPGQWVDFQAPGVQHVGGYSICSTPAVLQQAGVLELCVKASGHPCAQWVHAKAAPGDEVGVQAGGTFTLAQHAGARPALFVAGGIGITCLSSMLGQLVEQEQQQQQQQQQGAARSSGGAADGPHALAAGTAPSPAAATPPPPLLLYSAASPDEFALLSRLAGWQQQGLLLLQLHTTKVHGAPAAVQQQEGAPAGLAVRTGRITKADVAEALQRLRGQHGAGSSDTVDVDAYVCGPPQMTDEVVGVLEGLGVAKESIRTERWW